MLPTLQRKQKGHSPPWLSQHGFSLVMVSHGDPQGDTWGRLRAEATSCLSALGNWQQQYSATGQLRGHRGVFSKGRNFHKHGHHSQSDQEAWAFQVSQLKREKAESEAPAGFRSETGLLTNKAHPTPTSCYHLPLKPWHTLPEGGSEGGRQGGRPAGRLLAACLPACGPTLLSGMADPLTSSRSRPLESSPR